VYQNRTKIIRKVLVCTRYTEHVKWSWNGHSCYYQNFLQFKQPAAIDSCKIVTVKRMLQFTIKTVIWDIKPKHNTWYTLKMRKTTVLRHSSTHQSQYTFNLDTYCIRISMTEETLHSKNGFQSWQKFSVIPPKKNNVMAYKIMPITEKLLHA